MATTEMSGAEIVLKALADQGVEHMFGYPGGAVLPNICSTPWSARAFKTISAPLISVVAITKPLGYQFRSVKHAFDRQAIKKAPEGACFSRNTTSSWKPQASPALRDPTTRMLFMGRGCTWTEEKRQDPSEFRQGAELDCQFGREARGQRFVWPKGPHVQVTVG